MSSPFIGEIRMFARISPRRAGRSATDSIIPISENDALFNLIGTTYGATVNPTFALPNLQSRVPGIRALLRAQDKAPAWRGHAHDEPNLRRTRTWFQTKTTGSQANAKVDTGRKRHRPTRCSPALKYPQPFTYGAFVNDANSRTLGAGSIQNAGVSQPHDNIVPFLVHQLHPFAVRALRFPQSELTRRLSLRFLRSRLDLRSIPMANPFVAAIRIFAGNFALHRMGDMRRQIMADLAEHRLVSLLAPPMGATANPISPCRTCRARRADACRPGPGTFAA